MVARYQAPFFGSDRPDWLNERRGDPDWIAWLPRDDIPWWGVDRMRWGIDFSWIDSTASDAATQLNLANDTVRSRSFRVAGNLVYEAYQYRNFFIDVAASLQVRPLIVENGTNSATGEALLVVPRIGLNASRQSLISNLDVKLGLEGNLNAIGEADRANLGRAETDDLYGLFTFSGTYSTFLEPVLNPRAWRDPATHASSTLAHEVALLLRGQVALDDARLIPQANGAIGGLFSVRGYPQSTAVGDTLVVSSFEYRFHIPRVLPVRRQPLSLPLVGDFRLSPQQIYGRPGLGPGPPRVRGRGAGDPKRIVGLGRAGGRPDAAGRGCRRGAAPRPLFPGEHRLGHGPREREPHRRR